jgi:sec-independent protein translocase protein TatA
MAVSKGERMPGRLGGPELIIVLVVVLVLFGATKLPQLARSLGASAKEFKKGVEDGLPSDEAAEPEKHTTP